MKSDITNEEFRLYSTISSGDENAFRLLFSTYYQRLFHTSYYILGSKEAAEEAVSDVFYTLWEHKERFLAIENIERYLYTSVKHRSIQYLRQNSSSHSSLQDLYQIELLPDSCTPETILLKQEQLFLLQKAINTLPDKCREVFRLFLSDKLKQKEIATLLNISIKTVEAHIATAQKKIADILQHKEGG